MVSGLDLMFALGELTIEITEEGITVFGPFSGPGAPEVPATREAFRALAREDDAGGYRPLSGARSLRRDWRAHFADLDSFSAAAGEISPLAMEHNAMWELGELRVVGLEEVLARQAGRYAVAGELDMKSREAARAVLCARCVRQPIWHGGAPMQGTPLPSGAIACPEPCSVMVSLCREAALWQRDPPAPGSPERSVPFAAFEVPGNEVREAYLRTRYPDGNE